MNVKDLKEKEWYEIKCDAPEPIGYSGKALLVSLYAKNYPKGTFKFLCEDASSGYFTIDDIVGIAKMNKIVKEDKALTFFTNLLFKIGRVT